MLIFNRSYEVNSLTKTKYLSLMCDRIYEVSETIDFSQKTKCLVDMIIIVIGNI